MASQADTRESFSSTDDLILPPSSQNAIETTIEKFKQLNRVPLDKGPLSPLPSPRPRAKSTNSPPTFKEEILFKTRSSDADVKRKRPFLQKLGFLRKGKSEGDLNKIQPEAPKDKSAFYDSDEEYDQNFADSDSTKSETPTEFTEQEKQQRVSWLNRFVDNIKYSIVSKESEESFLQIVALLKLFIQDVKIKPLDITMSLMLLSTYHTCVTDIVHTDLISLDISTSSTLLHFSKFACAAYGWKLYSFREFRKNRKIFKLKKDDANLKVLLDETGIKPEDIINTQWSSGHFYPGHFVVVDQSKKAIVVGIRGTFHVKDCLTDLIASYEPFMGGYAHSGILSAARKKFTDLTPIILDTLKKFPEYQVVLVGHSLGAGTATLLSMLLYNEYNISLHCYAFAPPAILSLDLANKVKNFVTSVIVNDDIIPRLSWGSMEDLKKIVVNLLSQTDSNAKRIFQFLSAGNNLGESMTRRLSKYFGPAIPDLGTKKIQLSPRLYPPGKVYHIFSERTGIHRKYDVMEESHPSLFGDIIISQYMFTDHMPDLYEDALRFVVERLEKNKQ